ncbi:MAG: ATP-binding protein [Planctomycetota bacterium]|jgi:predicted AAA+ superfamily ATPase
MYFPRAVERALRAASKQFAVVLVTGPRQVGKTTLLRHLCEKGRGYVTLDDPGLRVLANEDPELFLQRFPPPVLIDEIQYAPGLLPGIKMAVDASRKPGRFWMTGSQQFRMMKGVTESLAGRVAVVGLLGFSGRERDRRELDVPPFLPRGPELKKLGASSRVQTSRSLFRAIWQGSYPALVAGETRDRDLFYSSYLQTYLQRDVSDLAQVGDMDAFVRFLRACAARTARMLNMTELANDCDVSVPTVKRWLSVLTASMQAGLLQPYHTNVTKRLMKTPKLYFLDTGLCSYLTGWSSPETLASGAMAGAVFETFVFGELLKSWRNKLREPRIYYYRDKDRREVDFVFDLDGKLHPVEAKLSASPKKDWVRHFAALDRLGPRGPGAVVCLSRDLVPLDRKSNAVPVGFL